MSYLARLFGRIADAAKPVSGLERVIQGVLSFVAPAYGSGAMLNRMRYHAGLMTRKQLTVPVLSVGNVTMGGTGKSPFTILLVEMLKAMGRRPGVLTRGYGRANEDALVVVHDGRKIKAGVDSAGDEPMVLARRFGDVPVIACSDRYRAGRLAVRRFNCDVLVMDDGFQHHQLERQGDFVLVDGSRPLEGLKLFPRGSLREPLSVLSKAHLLVLTRCEQVGNLDSIMKFLKAHAPHVPIVKFTTQIAAVVRYDSGEELTPEKRKGRRVIVACSVGNPDSVVAAAKVAGYLPVGLITGQDHAPLGSEQEKRAARLAIRRKAVAVLTTEKDTVKMQSTQFAGLPVEVLKIVLKPLDGESEKTLARVVRARLRGRTKALLAGDK